MNNSPTIDLFSAIDTRYGFLIGKIRALEIRLLKAPVWDSLLQAGNLQGVISILRQAGYGSALDTAENPSQWEKALEEYNKSIFYSMLDIAPEPYLIRLFLLKYDFHNIKVLLKQKLFSLPAGIIESYLTDWGTIPVQMLRNSIDKENFSHLPPIIGQAMIDTVRNLGRLDKTPQAVDILLDRQLYYTLYHKAKDKNTFLKKLFSAMIDIYNLSAFFTTKKFNRRKEFFDRYFLHHGVIAKGRFEQFYDDNTPDIIERLVATPYFDIVKTALSTWAEDRSLRKLDKAKDDFITKTLSRARLKAFGIEPVIAYIWAKEMELKNIKLIITGLQHNLQPGFLKEHLRRVYVNPQ